MNQETHRQQLSALLDGALDTERTRFLLRRLEHDGELAARLECWQLAGDALRGQVEGLAAPGFADAVAARISGQPPMPADAFDDFGDSRTDTVDAMPGATAPRRAVAAHRLGWFGGGALAASVVIAALLAWRLPLMLATPAPELATAADAGETSLPPLQATTPVPVASAEADMTDTGDEAPARVIAAAAPAPVRSTGRATRVQAAASRRVAARAPLQAAEPAVAEPTTVQVATAGPPVRLVADAEAKAPAPAVEADPFLPADAQAPARPWPRALFPGSGSGAFNASLRGADSSDPFAPREAIVDP
ncbi:RseA family anti-sigma factor [Luteimonas sp. e5]